MTPRTKQDLVCDVNCAVWGETKLRIIYRGICPFSLRQREEKENVDLFLIQTFLKQKVQESYATIKQQTVQSQKIIDFVGQFSQEEDLGENTCWVFHTRRWELRGWQYLEGKVKERDCSQGKEGPPRRKLACHPGQVELAKAGRLARPRADVKRVGNINWISWLPSMQVAFYFAANVLYGFL